MLWQVEIKNLNNKHNQQKQLMILILKNKHPLKIMLVLQPQVIKILNKIKRKNVVDIIIQKHFYFNINILSFILSDKNQLFNVSIIINKCKTYYLNQKLQI